MFLSASKKIQQLALSPLTMAEYGLDFWLLIYLSHYLQTMSWITWRAVLPAAPFFMGYERSL
jgi:hypothetical protein